MAAFVHTGITKGGKEIFALGQTAKLIRFSRIVMGDGFMEAGQTISETTSLTNLVMSLPIPDNGVEALGNGEVLLWAPFTSRELDMGFFYRELGAYAIHPDTGEEILYCYGNAEDLAEWIPATGGSTIIEKMVRIITVIGDAQVTAHLNTGIILTPEDLEKHNRDPDAHGGLRPTRHLTTIHHNQNRYPTCHLLELTHAAGVTPADSGPAGGTIPLSIDREFAFGWVDRNAVQVYTTDRHYAEGVRTQKLTDNRYAVLYPEGVKSLVITLQ